MKNHPNGKSILEEYGNEQTVKISVNIKTFKRNQNMFTLNNHEENFNFSYDRK